MKNLRNKFNNLFVYRYLSIYILISIGGLLLIFYSLTMRDYNRKLLQKNGSLEGKNQELSKLNSELQIKIDKLKSEDKNKFNLYNLKDAYVLLTNSNEFEKSLLLGKYEQLENLIANKVNFTIAASECCGITTKLYTINNLRLQSLDTTDLSFIQNEEIRKIIYLEYDSLPKNMKIGTYHVHVSNQRSQTLNFIAYKTNLQNLVDEIFIGQIYQQ